MSTVGVSNLGAFYSADDMTAMTSVLRFMLQMVQGLNGISNTEREEGSPE